MSIDVNDIGGPQADSYKFETIGDTCKGVITFAKQMTRENRFNGNDEETLIITLLTGDGERAIYPVTNTNVNGDGYASRMARAVAAAVRASGAKTLEVGGTLAVKYSEDIPTDKGNPAKGYVAEYKAPEPGADAAGSPDDSGAVTGLI